VDFHVHKDYSTGGSIFQEDGYKFKNSRKIEHSVRDMRKIDDVVKGKGWGPFEVFKLDIQGAELAALMGATETLKGAQVVIQQYNVGSP
jgi:FkbM family methyltransferase